MRSSDFINTVQNSDMTVARDADENFNALAEYFLSCPRWK